MPYKLTPLGNSVAVRIPRVDSPENAVLVYLYEHPEPVEVEELVGELRTTENLVLMVLNRFINKEYVKEL